MSKDVALGAEELVISDRSGRGCVLVVAPVIAFVAYHFVKASWSALKGAEPILDDSPVLNVVVALVFLLGSVLVLCLAVAGFVGSLRGSKMKFYERGLVLYGGWDGGHGRLLYSEIESLRLTEKHNMEKVKNRYGVPAGERYENTDYTFSFRLRSKRKTVRFNFVHDRNDVEVDAVVRRLELEGVRVERVGAKEKADKKDEDEELAKVSAPAEEA